MLYSGINDYQNNKKEQYIHEQALLQNLVPVFFSDYVRPAGNRLCHTVGQQAYRKKRLSGEKNLQLATQFLNINQPLKAITRLQKVLKANPDSAEAFGLLGTIYQHQGEYDLAGKNFKKALELAPDDSNIRNNYGTLLYAKKRYRDAAKQFHRVTKDVYYGNRDRVFENLGATYLRMGNTEKAIGYYQRALRLNAFLSGANLKLAEIFMLQDQPEKAYRCYINFVRNGRQTAESLWLGIRIASRTNHPEQGDTLWTTACQTVCPFIRV